MEPTEVVETHQLADVPQNAQQDVDRFESDERFVSAQDSVPEYVLEELLVQEISIDGMCGVY